MPESTQLWWDALRAIALVNIAAWAWAAWSLVRRSSALDPVERRLCAWQRALSAGYVAGCAWRSFVPVFDVPRLVMVDSWLSSVAIGRSVATVAELCFVAQWALLLHQVSSGAQHRQGLWVSRLLVPMIVLAELCSWHSVLSLSNLGHVMEESLWGLAAALWVASVVPVLRAARGAQRALLALWCVAGAVYAAYMFQVDVPMYWARWLGEGAAGRVPLDLEAGAIDAATRRLVSHRWEDWQGEATWMTLYFSVAVWLSIALVHAPRLGRQAAHAPQQRYLQAYQPLR